MVRSDHRQRHSTDCWIYYQRAHGTTGNSSEEFEIPPTVTKIYCVHILQHVSDFLWDICSVLLGTGNLFVWFGVLRYLGFFRTYNMLIITLKKAFPSVLRFLLCALLIYAGFTFCGWLIFGPYHSKVSHSQVTLLKC